VNSEASSDLRDANVKLSSGTFSKLDRLGGRTVFTDGGAYTRMEVFCTGFLRKILVLGKTDPGGKMRRAVVKRMTLTRPEVRKIEPLKVVYVSLHGPSEQVDLTDQKIVTWNGTSIPDHELKRAAAIGRIKIV
jgi:hypothetical protein